MIAPYRDDHQPLHQAAQHIGVAEELLDHFEQIPHRLVGNVSHEVLEALKIEARVAWEGVWDHLRQASEIVRGLGRPVGRYERARAQAGDIYVGAIDVRIVPRGRSYGGRRDPTISWRNAPTGPAIAAIASLRAAVPEVVVTRTPAPTLDLRSHGWLLDWWPLPVVVAIAGLVAWGYLA